MADFLLGAINLIFFLFKFEFCPLNLVYVQKRGILQFLYQNKCVSAQKVLYEK